MGLIQAAGTEPELARDEPETDAIGAVASIGAHRDLHGQPALPVGTQSFDAIALFAPIFGVGIHLSGEGVIQVLPANGRQIAGDIAVWVCYRCVIDVSWQEAKPVGILGLCDYMHFMAAFPAEPRRIEAMARGIGILQLALEKDSPRAMGQRRENLTGTGNEPMQLECKESAGPFAATRGFWQADAGQELLETSPACFFVETAFLRKLFNSIVEWDRLLALQFLPVIKADGQLGPDSEGMAPQRLIRQCFRQVAAKGCCQLRLNIFQF